MAERRPPMVQLPDDTTIPTYGWPGGRVRLRGPSYILKDRTIIAAHEPGHMKEVRGWYLFFDGPTPPAGPFSGLDPAIKHWRSLR